MTTTNQLIEEIKKSPAYINLTTSHQQLDEDGIIIGVSRQALDETLELFENALSQTEQECDKKWRTLIESNRKNTTIGNIGHGIMGCKSCGQQEDCKCDGYNQALDDLLNNK